MGWIVVLLAIAAAVLLFSFRYLERNLCKAREQLDRVKKGETSTRITLSSPNKAAEELFEAINEILDLRSAEESSRLQQEKTLRRQIADMSHDLRTPLTSILGYLQLLKGNLSEEERLQYLLVVEGRARTLQDLIASFYDLSRMEGGEYPLEKEPVDLRLMMSELIAEFYQDFEAAGFEIDVELQENLPPVSADRNAAARILTNLIGNALKHGKVFLTIRLYQEGESLVTSFSNDGTGLTQEDAACVFERFYTADRTRRQNTGLGMSIVRALTEQMGHEAAAVLEGNVFTVLVRWNLPENC